MKRSKVDGSNQRKVFACETRNQPIDKAKAEDARDRFAMRVIWVTLAIACAVLGAVLLMILLR